MSSVDLLRPFTFEFASIAREENVVPRMGSNLLHLISDDVMLEHIIPHLSDFDLFCSFSCVNKELQELCKSDLFWKLQIKYRLRQNSVDALQHITKDCATTEQKFKKLYSLHKLCSFCIESDGIHGNSKRYQLMCSFHISHADFVQILLLIKRKYWVDDDSIELYYYERYPPTKFNEPFYDENHNPTKCTPYELCCK